jgi:hypothetical protein
MRLCDESLPKRVEQGNASGLITIETQNTSPFHIIL